MVGKIQTFKLIIDRKGLTKKLIFDVLWSVMRHFPMSSWIIGINDHLNEARVIRLPNKVTHLTTKKVRSGNFNLFKSEKPVKKTLFSPCRTIVLLRFFLLEAFDYLWCCKPVVYGKHWAFWLPGVSRKTLGFVTDFFLELVEKAHLGLINKEINVIYECV